MAEIDRRHRLVGLSSRANVNLNEGDCEADPVPALWHQDDDEFFSESGFIERFWLPLSIAVLAGWGSISFVLFNAFGWVVILAIAGVAAAGAAAAVALVRAGDRNSVEMTSASSNEQSEGRFRNVA